MKTKLSTQGKISRKNIIKRNVFGKPKKKYFVSPFLEFISTREAMWLERGPGVHF